RDLYESATASASNLVDEEERIKTHVAGCRPVLKEKIGDFRWPFGGFNHVRLELNLQFCAAANKRFLQPMHRRNLQIYDKIAGEFDGVVHGGLLLATLLILLEPLSPACRVTGRLLKEQTTCQIAHGRALPVGTLTRWG